MDHRDRTDFNREFIIAALRFVTERADQGDEKANALLRAYTIKSANFDYDLMPELVASEVTFRDELPEKIGDAVNELSSFTDYVFANCRDRKTGSGMSSTLRQGIDQACAALSTLAVPDIEPGVVEELLNSTDELVKVDLSRPLADQAPKLRLV